MSAAAASRFADLWRRTAAGLALGALAAAAVWAGGWALAALAAAAAGGMAWELRRITFGRFDLAGAAAGAAGVLACLGTQAAGWRWGLLLAVAGLAAAAWASAGEDRASRRLFLAWAAWIALATSALVGLRDDPLYGAAAVLWVALSVVATDVGAYFAGRAIGGPRLWPAVSPGKTWSGLAGGVAAAAATGAVFSGLSTGTFAHQVALVSAAMAGLAQGGDLAESALKRRFGVKDSSRLIPGHGGLLDRLDGLLAAGLVAAAVTFLRGKSVFIW